jgi:HK97 family phage major capsid protein
MATQPDFHELDELRSVEELANLQGSLQSDLDALNTEYEGLPFPPEAGSVFADKTETHAEVGRRIAELTARKAVLAKMAGDENKVEAPTIAIKPSSRELDIYDSRAWVNAPTAEKRDQILRDHAMRAVEVANIPDVRQKADEAKHRISTFLDYSDSKDKELARRILATGAPDYRKAFQMYVETSGESRAAALAVGVDTTGGFSVPFAFDPTIIGIGAWTNINPYRAACRTVTISGTDTWQALTATAVVAAWATEAAAATEQGPTFAKPEFIAKRAHAFVTASYEMVQDRPDLAAELGTLFAEAKDNLEESSFTTGVGTTVNPQGMFLDGAFTAIETVTNNVYAIADVYALESGLPIRHRANGAWFFNRSVIHTTQGFETVRGELFGGTNYGSVGTVQTNPGGNTGLRLLGYPVWEVPTASALITTSGAIIGVFCDPRNYVILDRIGMSVKVIPDMLNGATPSFPTGEVGVYAFWRGTARVLNADAGRQIKVNAP